MEDHIRQKLNRLKEERRAAALRSNLVKRKKRVNTMQQTTATLPEIKLMGIAVRTNNADTKIGPTMQQYFQESVADKMANRKNPGTTYSVYTDYESDHNGNYTYFIGEEVESFDGQSSDLKPLTIPTQSYAKFTNGPGVMPGVCIDVWQKVWQMTPGEFGGKRNWQADFEVYDSRAHDPSNTTLDVYVGVGA